VTRPNYDPDLEPWAPPPYSVDERGKVSGAVAGKPNNWGRWGDDDQVGTLNLLTPDVVAAAATLARTGRRFSLAVPIGVEVPSFRPPPMHLLTTTSGDAILGDGGIDGGPTTRCSFSDDWLLIALQYTTQLDGFGFGVDDTLYNGFWTGLVTARSGMRRLGIHHRAAGVVGRAVLLDVARYVGASHLPAGFRVGPELLEQTAGAQGVEIRRADILLVRTGFLSAWLEGRLDERDAPTPGLSARTIEWLHSHDIAMVAADNPAIEVTGPTEDGWRPNEFHIRALRDLGLQLGEFFDLDAYAADCVDDGVYEALFVAAPLPVVAGAGSPLNPIVVK
jgi:kynurenine formamidase